MIVHESFKRDLARLIVWYPVRWGMRFLPIRTAFWVMNRFGDLHWLLTKKKGRHFEENLRRAFPSLTGTQVGEIHRTYLQNHYLDRLHIFTYPKLRHPGVMQKISELKGFERLEQTLQQNKGAIIVLGHYGPIQLPLFNLGTKGYRLLQIGLPTDEGVSWIGKHVAFRLRLLYEALIPARILPATTFLRPVFEQLQSNGVVMMNIDFAGGGRWIGKHLACDFLGQSVAFPLGAATLSAKTGAPLMPLSITKVGDEFYCFEIHPPIEAANRTPEEITSDLVKWYEDEIRNAPGLWHFWDEFEPGKLIVRE
jgi:phosphatidylinositol dimannoside acyltransferase